MKSAIRTPKQRCDDPASPQTRRRGRQSALTLGRWRRRTAAAARGLGFRISGFGFPSDFGLRPSEFGRHQTALLTLLTCAFLLSAHRARAAAPRTVDVASKPGDPWRAYPTRTLEDLPAAARAKTDTDLTPYGGLRSRREKATGFFHAKQIDGRWWLVDPDGGRFLHKGVASVRPLGTPGARAALQARFGSASNWAAGTVSLLRDHGFNGLGGWSDAAALRPAPRPLVHTRIWNFMSGYGQQRGGTYQQPGHTGYPNDCLFVFDPQFEKYCDTQARQLAADRHDPWLLGHFSDNELPLKREALTNYLKFPARDPGHRAALKFLQARHGPGATAQAATPKDLEDFLAVVVGRYFEVVGRAIKRYDPNHLYLGSRFHGAALRCPEIFRACGPHVDVVSVNYYRAWTPDRDKLELWARESGKPVLITEWYAKGADAALANTGGAGWLVKTQADRGSFYQNFVLGLLESKSCVGWHWFKYSDNDPDDTKADPSNRDSNKGIVNNRYEPYTVLLEAMQPVNDRAYGLVEYFDRQPAPPARAAR